MRGSVMRVVLAVTVVAAGAFTWTDAVEAGDRDINATTDPEKCDKTWGPPCFTPGNGTVTEVTAGDTVTWHILEGTHTVTPVDKSAFKDSGELTGPDATFSVTFEKVGVFSFYCRRHGRVEDGGKTHHGMWGKIDVRAAPTTTTSEPPPPDPPPGSEPPQPEPQPQPEPAPAPQPTKPPPPPPPPPSSGSSPPPTSSQGSTGPSGSGSQGPPAHGQTAAGSGRPWVGPPPSTPPSPPPSRAAAGPTAPSTTQPPKPKANPRDNGADPREATAVPPDELVLPPSPAFPTPTTTPVAGVPSETPQGDTVAVLKSEQGGHRRRLILFGTLFGVGAFALGVGGWKYTHRSSKYWPA